MAKKRNLGVEVKYDEIIQFRNSQDRVDGKHIATILNACDTVDDAILDVTNPIGSLQLKCFDAGVIMQPPAQAQEIKAKITCKFATV